MFSCPTGTYQCNADSSGSCKITLENLLTCGPNNNLVVNSNTIGLNLSGAYCYPQSSNVNNNSNDASYIACVPSLDKKTTSPGCKSGYTRCDSGGNNTCSVGPLINASNPCTDNFGNNYSIRDIKGLEIPGALCHINSNTACRPVLDDCSCKPFETCVQELTDVCKAPPPICDPPCENGGTCELNSSLQPVCNCDTAQVTVKDCYGSCNTTTPNGHDWTFKFTGSTCTTPQSNGLPDGFITQMSCYQVNKDAVTCNSYPFDLQCNIQENRGLPHISGNGDCAAVGYYCGAKSDQGDKSTGDDSQSCNC